MHLVQMLLPINADAVGVSDCFNDVMDELSKRFGGVTAFVNSPAEGIWEAHGRRDRDRMVTVETMVTEFDAEWWASYRAKLERVFAQEEIVIRAIAIQKV